MLLKLPWTARPVLVGLPPGVTVPVRSTELPCRTSCGVAEPATIGGVLAVMSMYSTSSTATLLEMLPPGPPLVTQYQKANRPVGDPLNPLRVAVNWVQLSG